MPARKRFGRQGVERGRSARFRPELVWDYERVAVELVRALRGRRSQVGFSRRLGYESSAAHRWESRRSWPTAAEFLTRIATLPLDVAAGYERFFQRRPQWLDQHDPGSPPAVAALLQQLRGKTPINDIATASGHNRYTVSRWFRGTACPKLPDFLCLIDVCSRRLLDFIEVLVDPSKLPSLKEPWLQLERMRDVAYERPWTHAVLRALEIEHPAGAALVPWLARMLGIGEQQASEALELLSSTGQIRERKGKSYPSGTMTVNTGHDPARANALRIAWARLAVERMEAGAPGHSGYSLFAIGKSDLARLRDIHVQYIRAMQDVIAACTKNECVALFCAQLFDLNTTSTNALSAP
jgi:hypothetical protein